MIHSRTFNIFRKSERPDQSAKIFIFRHDLITKKELWQTLIFPYFYWNIA